MIAKRFRIDGQSNRLLYSWEVWRMRLGELRTIIKDFDNKLVIKLACYDEIKGVSIHNLEFDMSNDNEMYFRVVNDD